MDNIKGYRSLKVWQRAKDLTVRIYRLTQIGDFSKDFGLKDQIRRASVSCVSNIAEGHESGTNKMSIRYFNISKGSIAEVQTQIIIAYEIGYIKENDLKEIESECDTILAMLTNLIKRRLESLKPKT